MTTMVRKFGNIEIERNEHGEITIRKVVPPRSWPERTSNTVTLSPSDLEDVLVALDDALQQQPPPSDLMARELVDVIADGGRDLARNIYGRSYGRRAVVRVEVHPETYAEVLRGMVARRGAMPGYGDHTPRRTVIVGDVVVEESRSRDGDPRHEVMSNASQSGADMFHTIVDGALALRESIYERTGFAPTIDIECPPRLYERMGESYGPGRFFRPCRGVEISVMQSSEAQRNGGRGEW